MNAIYTKGLEGLLSGNIKWTTDNVKVLLIDTSAYTVDLANHTFLSSVPEIARVSTSPALTGKTSTNGVASANSVTLTNVAGASVEALLLFVDTGAATSSRLLAYLDTVTGLPITPNGGDIEINWPSGGIFSL